MTQWHRGHCLGENGGCGPGGSHVGMYCDLNLLLADIGRLARATNQHRARYPSRPIGSVSIFGDWLACHRWSLGETSLCVSDGRHSTTRLNSRPRPRILPCARRRTPASSLRLHHTQTYAQYPLSRSCVRQNGIRRAQPSTSFRVAVGVAPLAPDGAA